MSEHQLAASHEVLEPAAVPSDNPFTAAQQPQQHPSSETPLQPPPVRTTLAHFADDDVSNPVSYVRDPHVLVAYLVPFPTPHLPAEILKTKTGDTISIPPRFFIYTPPPPPLVKPAEGEKESTTHKLQRKWQEEVREAKTSDAKVASWKGIKGKATKGINWAIGKTTSAELDFLTRIPNASGGSKKTKGQGGGASRSGSSSDATPDSDHESGQISTGKTVGLSEMVLVYPPSLGNDTDKLRQEFVESMLRTKSKAQKDAIIATGLMPVALAVDIAVTLVWPFGGLAEIDGVWAASSITGAKTARSVTKRLTSSTKSGELKEDDGAQLKLTFKPSSRDEVLARFLAARCEEQDRKLFPRSGTSPSTTEVLDAIGWSPSHTGGASRNWEDDAWEREQVKEDLETVMGKAAKQWDKWCTTFAKDPVKALKNDSTTKEEMRIIEIDNYVTSAASFATSSQPS